MLNTPQKLARVTKRGVLLLACALLALWQVVLPASVMAQSNFVFDVIGITPPTPRRAVGISASDDGSLYATTTTSSPSVVSSAYVVDRLANTAEYVGYDTDGSSLAARQISTNVSSFSADGRYVVFNANGVFVPRGKVLQYAYVYDRVQHTSTRIIVPSDITLQTGTAGDASISADGRYIPIKTGHFNGSGDTKDYIYDRVTGGLEPIVAPDGSPVKSQAFMGADGRYVLFNANGLLYIHDRQTGSTDAVSSSGESADIPSLSSDGRYVSYWSHPAVVDPSLPQKVKVVDRLTNTVIERQGTVSMLSADGSALVVGTNGGVVTYESPVGSTPVTINTTGIPQSINHDGTIFTTQDGYSNEQQPDRMVFVHPADTTPPVVVGTPDRQPDSGTWYNHDVTVSWTATDPNSSATTPSDTTISTEGANQTATSDQSCNPDGFCATGTYDGINIDKTAPILGSPVWTANPLQQGQDTMVSIPASDALSGIASVQYILDAGAPQSMIFDSISNSWKATFGSNLLANTYNVTFTAVDQAGNTSQQTNDILAVYSASNGYVTGHAKTLPTTADTLPIAIDTSNNPTKLVLGFTNVMSPAMGSFDINYSIKNNKDEFKLSSTAISWAVISDSTHASILGHADMTTYVNGTQTVTQNMAVRFDITLGTNGTPDHITIKLFNPSVDPNTGTPAYTISNDVLANGSNLMIHP
jgi:hypothetical protein